MKTNSNISGFSIIEVMIAIFIFSMAMASIFMVISSSINVNNMNKNHIIASNLSREGIEIIRNIRDLNYKTYHKYNWIPNDSNDFSKTFELGKYYKVENDFSSSEYPFELDISGNQVFSSNSKQDFLEGKFDDYVFCIKKNINIYSHYCNGDDRIVKMYRYIYLDELKDEKGNIIEDGINVKSKVVWYDKGYYEFEINTILTDFNRL